MPNLALWSLHLSLAYVEMAGSVAASPTATVQEAVVRCVVPEASAGQRARAASVVLTPAHCSVTYSCKGRGE